MKFNLGWHYPKQHPSTLKCAYDIVLFLWPYSSLMVGMLLGENLKIWELYIFAMIILIMPAFI